MHQKGPAAYQSLPLLYWQHLVFSAAAGVFALAFPVYGVLAFFLLFLLTVLRYRDRRILRLVLLAAVFALSFCFALWREPKQSVQSTEYYAKHFDPMQERTLCAKIESVQGASGRRIRMVLSGVHIKEDGICTHGGETLQGRVLYTWDRAFPEKKRPCAGQFLQVKTRLRPFYGDLRAYYARQDIWYGAWNYGAKNMYSLHGQGDFWASRREDLRFAFASLLFAEKFSAEKPEYALKTAEGQAKAIIMALFFGDKFYLTQSTLDDFNAANLLHSLALSGQHLSLAAVLTLVLLFAVQRVRPFVYEYVPRPLLAVYAGLVLGFLYCWLGSAPYSLLRAYAMLCIGAFFYIRAKDIVLLDILFYALGFFVLFDPLSLYDLGVQLSFACVFAIAYLLPFLRFVYDRFFCRLKKPLDKILFSVFSLLAVSFGIQLALAPLLIVYFGQVSWFFVLNALWLPLLTFWVMPLGLLALLCMAFPFAEYVLDLACVPVVLAVRGFDALFSGFFPFVQCARPMGLAFLGFYIAVLLCCYGLKKRSLAADVFAALGFVFLFLPVFVRIFAPVPDLFVSVLDVGQGQAVYIQTKAKRLLFDTGGTNSVRFNAGRDIAAKYVTQNQAPYLDMLIASHDDSDHINGMVHLLRNFSVGEYCESAVSVSKKTYAKKVLDRELAGQGRSVCRLGAGDYLDLGAGYGLKILFPPKEPPKSGKKSEKSAEGRHFAGTDSLISQNALSLGLKKYSANNASLAALLVKEGTGIMLLCGDSEKDVLSRLAAYYGKALRAEILLLAHHGSQNSFDEDFYGAVSPREVWASSGKYNRYGFPSQAVRDYFGKRNIPLHATAWDGDLFFVHENGKILHGKKTFLQELFSVL